jgi:serine phosphatase RsbU (regulator of sigma subunit)
MEFDSETWSNIYTPDVALSLKGSMFDERIYVGGRNFFGYLSLNGEGNTEYYSFPSDSLLKGNFTEIIETDSTVYFYSSHVLVSVDRISNKIINKWTNKNKYYIGLFSFKNKVYLNVINDGIFEINGDKLKLLELPKLINKQIIFSCRFSNSELLIGTDNGDLFLFNGNLLSSYTILDNEFIRTGILSDGVFIDDKRLALSTKNFGVVIIDKETGNTLNNINYDSGLPNDFIMDLFIDRQKGLWLAHSYGLSRIDAQLPLTNYSSFPGLNSSIITLNYWNNKLFVASSTGVYVLDTINRYATKESVKRIPVSQMKVIPPKIEKTKEEQLEKQVELKPEQIEAGQPKSKQQKKGFFRKLFGKNEEVKEKEVLAKPKIEIPIVQEESIESHEPVQQFELFKYQEYVLKSKDYGFSQLPLINRKCKLLIPYNQYLLAVTDAKIYTINKQKETAEIFSNIHIYNIVLSQHHSNLIYALTEDGIYTGFYNSKEDQWDFSLVIVSSIHFNATDILEFSENTLLIALSDKFVRYSFEDNQIEYVEIDNPYGERLSFKSAGKKDYLTIGDGLYSIGEDDSGKIVLEKNEEIILINSLKNQVNNFWLRCENSEFRYFGKPELSDKVYPFLKVFNNLIDIHVDHNGNIWVIDDYEKIYQLNSKRIEDYDIDVSVIIKHIKTLNGEFVMKEDIKLKYSNNALRFNIISPSYLKYNSNQFQYIIEGLMEEWSDWSHENIISVPYIPSGNYTFKVRARNLFGNISEIESISFRITPPFWKTPYFYAITALLIISIIHYRQRYKTKKYIQEKRILQEKVKERTVELELKNKSITDSIVYAERIQKGMLPARESILTCLSDYFILYKPRNIVSGDFYFLTQKENRKFVVAADCTGHGVPGAFMSMLGIAYLNEIIRKSPSDITAAAVLESLRDRIVKLFSQETSKTNDGMDVALLIIDSDKNSLEYSGAYNPLYQVTSKKNKHIQKDKIALEKGNHILLSYKADRFHVGKAIRGYKNFTNHTIKYSKDDIFYIFSDGFVDQFGGEEESKFKYGPFKKLILEICDKPMGIQKETLKARFKDWQGNNEQTDDILIWGLKP